MGAALQLQLPLAPDALQLNLGRWRMRNGNAVEITAKLNLVAQGPHGKFPFACWQGHCVLCGDKFTWNLDGRYAAVGENPFDIVGSES